MVASAVTPLIEQIRKDGAGDGRAFGWVGAAQFVEMTSERASAFFKISTMLVTCDEKVDRLCSMDCSSPMSA